MLIMCAFFDDLHDFAHYQYTPECVIRIAVSCVFALGVNISNYLVLGKTSPLTYQVCVAEFIFLQRWYLVNWSFRLLQFLQ